MPSSLENIPCDVLQHIAYLSTSPFPTDDLLTLRQLLSTNQTIYRSICVKNCPSLYANIFRDKFDIGAPKRRFNLSLTDSSLAAELVHRQRTLLRIRRRDTASVNFEQDMWTAYLMVLENESRNVTLLARVGFSEFLLGFVRSHLRYGRTCEGLSPANDTVRSLVLWSYCLTAPRRDITSLRGEYAEELLSLVRPYAMPIPRPNNINRLLLSSHLPTSSSNHGIPSPIHVLHAKNFNHDASRAVQYYARSWRFEIPDIASAAIIITFILKELTPLAAPPHLPLDRASAIAHGRAGPTMEDFHRWANRRTPLLADNNAAEFPDGATLQRCLNREVSDHDFNRMVHASPEGIYTPSFSYTPGTLSGTWEGTYWNAPVVPTTTLSERSPTEMGDFLGCQAFQCHLTEYLSFSPNIPLPTADFLPHAAPSGWDYRPSHLIQTKDGFEWASSQFLYERFDRASRSSEDVERDPRQALDVIITGETPSEEEEAWGAYRFAGKVRLRDGFITLRKEPKYPEDEALGSWLFEGRLYYGAAFIGKWRMLGAATDHCCLEGIFSIRKRSGT